MIIREATSSDIKALAALFDAYRQFYQQAPNIELAKSFISSRLNNKDSIILVAENLVDNNNEKLIGFCQIYPSFCSVIAAPIGILYDLFVDSSSRKTGAGKALMLAAHEVAASSGFARLDLTTAKTNLAAQALYESLGWVRDEMFYTYNKEIIK